MVSSKYYKMKIMKKYIYILWAAFLAAITLASCSDDEGTNPGSDSNPVITIYQYDATKPNNPDNDVVLRLAANSKTTEAWYIAEKTTEKEARIASLGESGYQDYVISNGTKIDGIDGTSNVDITLTDLYGAYTITIVAVNGGQKTSAETTFTGLEWEDVVAGTYRFGASPDLNEALGLTTVPTVLQICTTNDKLYRFKDVFGDGYSLKLNLIDIKGSDEDGEYQFFRVPIAETSYIFGNYGTVSVRDIGYWQGNDAFVTENGYESGMYANYSCFVYIQYFVSGGNLGYGYDYFIPQAGN